MLHTGKGISEILIQPTQFFQACTGSSEASKLLHCGYILRCVLSGQWKDLFSIWLTCVVITGSVDLYCLGTAVGLGGAINSCCTVGVVSQKCTFHKQTVSSLCGGGVYLAYKRRSLLDVFVLSWITQLWDCPPPSGAKTYNAIMLWSFMKPAVQVQRSFVSAAYFAFFYLMAHYLRLIWQGWVLLGKQAVGTLSTLVELQKCFWSPSVTFEGGHVYASWAIRMTLDQKDRIEMYVERRCNALRDAEMIRKGSGAWLPFLMKWCP